MTSLVHFRSSCSQKEIQASPIDTHSRLNTGARVNVVYLLTHATMRQKLGGRNQAKPKSRAPSARDLRTEPESRVKPQKEGGGVWEGARRAPP